MTPRRVQIGAQAARRARSYLEAQGLEFVAAYGRAQFPKPAGELDGFKPAKPVGAACAHLASRVRGAQPPCRFAVVAIDGSTVNWIRNAFDA